MTPVHRIVCTALLGWFAVSAGSARGAEPTQLRADEYHVKAAFLYNFVKFVQWPPERQSGVLVIGVAGDDAFGELIDQLVRGKPVQGRELTVRLLDDDDDPRAFHVVFIGEAAARRTAEILMQVQQAGVLTVGETPHFLREGGIIRFYSEGSRIRFQIDALHAQHAGLKINSQLLSLAKR